MADSMKEILNPGSVRKASPAFPHAPIDWDETAAIEVATEEGLSLEDHHWQVIRALQEFFARNEEPKPRELHDALDEKFHALGGLKFLYTLLPGGPVAQGCRLAGLTAPMAAEDESSGSVQ
jgi:TusE/DsrC/DsvC family sulfur relay protein